MKTICINEKRFAQCIGYGLWSFVSIGLLFVIFASAQEIQTINEIENETLFRSDNTVCYINFFVGEKCTTIFTWLYDGINPVDRHWWSMVLSIINVIVIGIWIYYKQQKVKFSFCKGSQSHDGVKESK